MPHRSALLAVTVLIAAPAAAMQRDAAADPAGAQVLVDATPLLLDVPPASDRGARDPLPPTVVRRMADGATVTTISVGGRLAADRPSTVMADDPSRAAAPGRRRPKRR